MGDLGGLGVDKTERIVTFDKSGLAGSKRQRVSLSCGAASDYGIVASSARVDKLLVARALHNS